MSATMFEVLLILAMVSVGWAIVGTGPHASRRLSELAGLQLLVIVALTCVAVRFS
jgi:hypothetical protein